jgi:hypothetical protein
MGLYHEPKGARYRFVVEVGQVEQHIRLVEEGIRLVAVDSVDSLDPGDSVGSVVDLDSVGNCFGQDCRMVNYLT